VAILAAGDIQFLEDLAPQEQWQARTALLRRHAPVALDALDVQQLPGN
jgi:hypothetical protein